MYFLGARNHKSIMIATPHGENRKGENHVYFSTDNSKIIEGPIIR